MFLQFKENQVVNGSSFSGASGGFWGGFSVWMDRLAHSVDFGNGFPLWRGRLIHSVGFGGGFFPWSGGLT